MATTSRPLVWDFYKKIDDAKELGGVAHFFDEEAQILYLNDGLKTKTGIVPEGHWSTSIFGDTINVLPDKWTQMNLDHPTNGILYGVVNTGSTVEFVRYIYGMDISNLVDSWSIDTSNDNGIHQLSASVYNIDYGVFGADTTLFQPGARLVLKIKVGEDDPYTMESTWLDEINYDRTSDTVDISGRNHIGFFLNDQTFDDLVSISGSVSAIVKTIFDYAGLASYIIQDLPAEIEFKFDPSDTLLSGLEQIIDYYTSLTDKIELLELPNGTVCFGYDTWISQYIPRNVYSFDEGRDVYSRSTNRALDGAYTAVRVTGKDIEGKDLIPVISPIANFPYWALTKHKTIHLKAPDGLTQEALQEWASAQSVILQYVGVGEDFTCPFRPDILVGDIASVKHANQAKRLGIITQVKHKFSTSGGYVTSFSVDSGGIATDVSTMADSSLPLVYSRTANVNGFNRKQNIVDLIRYTSKQVK